MERDEYAKLYSLESDYWWFRVLRGFLKDAFRQASGLAKLRILDAGCGTGQTLVELIRELHYEGIGLDISADAAQYWAARNLDRMCQASVNEIPFGDSTFGGVVCTDVLYHDRVDPLKAYQELWRVTKQGGLILITVPALKWLKTESHHRAVQGTRRFTKSSILALVSSRPVEILRVTYLFFTVFPLIATFRLILRIFLGRPRTARSEFARLPKIINDCLTRLLAVERKVVNSRNMPAGSTLLAVLRRK